MYDLESKFDIDLSEEIKLIKKLSEDYFDVKRYAQMEIDRRENILEKYSDFILPDAQDSIREEIKKYEKLLFLLD